MLLGCYSHVDNTSGRSHDDGMPTDTVPQVTDPNDNVESVRQLQNTLIPGIANDIMKDLKRKAAAGATEHVVQCYNLNYAQQLSKEFEAKGFRTQIDKPYGTTIDFYTLTIMW